MTSTPPLATLDATFANQHLVDQGLWARLVDRVLVQDAEFERLFGAEDPHLQRLWAEKIVDQALGFLQLCATVPDAARYAPAPLVDIGWHAFLLHSVDYAAFCHRLAGRFIHHEPTGGDGPVDALASVTRTADAMAAHGIGVIGELWPRSAASCSPPAGPKMCAPTSCSPG